MENSILEEWKSLLDKSQIGYRIVEYDVDDEWAKYHFGDYVEKKSICIELEAKEHNKIDGYMGFQTRIVFNENGEFVKIDIYE